VHKSRAGSPLHADAGEDASNLAFSSPTSNRAAVGAVQSFELDYATIVLVVFGIVSSDSLQFASSVAGWYYFANAAGWRLRLC
jgi:hypothetical protein